MRHLMLMAGLLWGLTISAQTYRPLDDSSTVGFGIKNFGITVDGTLKGLKGGVHFEPGNLSTAAFTLTADAGTINTGIDMRDNHLKKEEYFYVDSFPLLSFKSTKVTASTKEGYLFLFGDLTIKGVTKSVSFPFQAIPNGTGYTLLGSFSLNRRDYGIGGSSISMSDEVKIDLKIAVVPDK
jgi:polyisoprenoid-binding protein YceI